MVDLTLPTPILFHPLKHHLGRIKEFLRWDGSPSPAELVGLKQQLLTLGQSQLDLYVGQLSVQQVAHQVSLFLQEKHLLGQQAYRHWLDGAGSYGLMPLSDGSWWVLRWGNEPDRYVHIHPARYSPHTVRVKAGSLKTAMAVIVWGRLHSLEQNSLITINQARTCLLHYPPIKSLRLATAIERMMTLLSDEG
jgi:hypothetical protein